MNIYVCNLRPCYIASIDSLTHISDADDALDARKLCVNLAPGFACHPPQAPRPVSRFKENLCLAKKGKRKWGDRPVLDGPNMRLNLSTHTHTQRIVAGTYATYATVCHCIALGAFVPRSASIAFLIGGLTTATPTQAQCTHRHTHTHKQRQLVLQYKARPCASRGIKRFLTCSRATPATRGASKQREINC